MEGSIIELNMPETNPIKSSHFQCNATAVNYCLHTKDFLHVMPGKCTSLIFSLNTSLLSNTQPSILLTSHSMNKGTAKPAHMTRHKETENNNPAINPHCQITLPVQSFYCVICLLLRGRSKNLQNTTKPCIIMTVEGGKRGKQSRSR